MFTRFWWGSNDERCKIHWHSWKNLSLPKCKGGMGFRDLKTFNAALLAKQSWKLMTEENPLLTAVFKARYFKNSSILKARRGYSPSYTWRSIWGAKSVLLEGLGWRIGNGCLVDASHDIWVPFGGKIESPRSITIAQPEMWVADFINFEKGEWNFDCLSQFFDEDSVSAIMSIPWLSCWGRDKLFWWLTKDGEYSVKSGYWLGLMGNQRSEVSPDAADERKQWARIWNL